MIYYYRTKKINVEKWKEKKKKNKIWLSVFKYNVLYHIGSIRLKRPMWKKTRKTY